MLLYFWLLFLLLYAVPNIKMRIVWNINGKRRDSGYLFWIFLMFFIAYIWMYGLRDMGGADDAAYRLYYERNYGGGVFDFLSTDKEPLFNSLKVIGYTFGLNYKVLFLGYAIVDICFLIAALRNYFSTKSDLILYLAAFYFVVFSSIFTTMRQGAAMAILFYLYSIDKPGWKKKLLLWFLMVCSHYGFLILLPFEILISLKDYHLKKTIKIIVPFACLFIGLAVDLGGIIQKITGILGLFDYMNSGENYIDGTNISIVALVLFAVYLYLLLADRNGLIYFSERSKRSFDKILYGNMMYLSIMFLTAKLKWGNRLGYYYFFTVPMLIPCFYKALPVKEKGLLLEYGFITIMFIGFLFVMKDVLGNGGYVWSLNFLG